MKIRTIVGLGLIGTALYAHKRHGGEMTVNSLKSNLNRFLMAIQNKANEVKERAEELTDRAQDKVKDVAATASSKAKSAFANVEDEVADVGETPRNFGEDIGAQTFGPGDSGITPRR